MGKLVSSVDKFKPDLEVAQELIETDKKLFKALEEFPKYDKIDERLNDLEKQSQEVDKKTSKILEVLNSCHAQLNSLPALEQVLLERDTMLKQREKIYSGVLLDYAMKLAKFTRVPPTFDKGMVGPNNFIWPAEDAMRRGMLAMASLKSKELTRIPGQENEEHEESEENRENEENGEKETKPETKSTLTENESETVAAREEIPRRSSFEFTADDSHKKDQEESLDEGGMDLDLDLFDPDEF